MPHDHIFRTHALCSKPIRWLATRLNCTAELIEHYQQTHVFWITPEAIFFISPKHYLVVGLSQAIRVELRRDYSIRIHSDTNYTDTPPLCRASTAIHILNRMLAGHTPSNDSPHCSDCHHFTPPDQRIRHLQTPPTSRPNQLLPHHRQPRLVPRFQTIRKPCQRLNPPSQPSTIRHPHQHLPPLYHHPSPSTPSPSTPNQHNYPFLHPKITKTCSIFSWK